MTEPVYYMERPLTRSGEECFAYMWLGQSLKYCDNCGQPFWEHTHVEQWGKNNKPVRKIISAGQRERVKLKWEQDYR